MKNVLIPICEDRPEAHQKRPLIFRRGSYTIIAMNEISRTRITCPICGSDQVIPIVYGTPGMGMWEEAERGLIKLGGSNAWQGLPDLFCKSCEYEWPD